MAFHTTPVDSSTQNENSAGSRELTPEVMQPVAWLEQEDGPPPWDALSPARRQALVEAMIFASEQPLAVRELRAMLGIDRSELMPVLEAIKSALEGDERGISLEEVAGGLVFRTRPELAPHLRILVKTRPPRLTRAALECLAVVAYKQPVTRAEVESVRGVESGFVLKSLLEKRLLRILGRKEEPGRPMIYGTTKEFLSLFGLKDLTALPTLRDLQELADLGAAPTLKRVKNGPSEHEPTSELTSASTGVEHKLPSGTPRLLIEGPDPDIQEG